MQIGSTHAMSGAFTVEALSVIVAQMNTLHAHTMEDVDKNVSLMMEWMDRASFGYPGYDIFVVPECAFHGSPPDLNRLVLRLDGPQVARLRAKCSELGVWGVFTGSFAYQGKTPCNLTFMVNDRGEIVHEYVKMNTFHPFETHYPGWKMPVTSGPKGSKIATIICADGDYPEMWREAAHQGANVIIRPSRYMSPWDQAWEITNRACAYCTQTYVVACNAVGIDNGFVTFGDSMIVNPDGGIVCRASRGTEWLLKADLYPQIVDHMRANSASHNFQYAYRHRGATHRELAGIGATDMPYQAYQTGEKGEGK